MESLRVDPDTGVVEMRFDEQENPISITPRQPSELKLAPADKLNGRRIALREPWEQGRLLA